MSKVDPALEGLRVAVRVAVGRYGALLAAGELLVVRRFLDLDEAAGALFARLFGRRPGLKRVEAGRYRAVPDPFTAVRALVDAGLAWDALRTAPAARLAEVLRVPSLRRVCRALDRPASGRRADLLARVTDPEARPMLVEALGGAPVVWLRHRGLFTRLVRWYLHDARGDLSRLVVARLGVLRFPDYVPTGGPGLFRDRRALLSWEAALARQARLEGEALAADAPRAVAAVEALPRTEPPLARFSARRIEADLALAGARELERRGRIDEAARIYERLLSAGIDRVSHAAWRLALCREAVGRPAEGARICRDHLDQASAEMARVLERTGRRLARKAGMGWCPLPPLRLAPRRRIVVSPHPAGVEAAVVSVLARAGRQAVHGENALWTTLFGLLFRRVLFAPVPGMLPCPWLTGPLDLGRPGFADRRRALVEETLHAIASGEAPARLRAVMDAHHGEVIAGVSWRLAEDALALCSAVDGPSLAAILRLYAEDWRGAARGMPDICVFPGPQVRVEGWLPARLGEGIVLAEIKGPGDSPSDAQRIWLDRLIRARVTAEIWRLGWAAG